MWKNGYNKEVYVLKRYDFDLLPTEVWIDVVGYEGLYKCSDMGRVASCNRVVNVKGRTPQRIASRLLRNRKIGGGYMMITLCNKKIKQVLVHRIIAAAFIPNPENKPQVNHKNGIKDDNRVENLEWVSSKENINHSWEIGLSKKVFGETTSCAKLKNNEVIEIFNSTDPYSIIAAKFNTTNDNIRHIKLGRSWRHITGLLPFGKPINVGIAPIPDQSIEEHK